MAIPAVADDAAAAERRQHLVSALAATLSAKGLGDTTVTDVVDRAQTTVEAFYQQFESIQECWRTGFEDLAHRLANALDDAPATGAPLGRFDALLSGVLAVLTQDTVVSAHYLSRLHTNAPHVMARRLELQAQFVDRLADIFDAHTTSGRFACKVLGAATSNLITQALVEGGAEEVLDLRRPLVHFAEQTLC